MNNNNIKTFAKLMGILAEIFDDGREPSAFKVEIYFKALEQFTIEELSQAVQKMITNRVYPSFPKPAEIIEAIRGTQDDLATIAWVKVLEAIRRVGSYESAQFDDPVIHSVIEVMGGWIELGNMQVDEEKWKQKEFEKLYRVMNKKGKHPTYLIGRIEQVNTATGFADHIPEPMLIGDFGEAVRGRERLTQPTIDWRDRKVKGQ